MIPRGTPDLSWVDLGAGLLGGIIPDSAARMQARVEARWSRDNDSLVCLSVRSGFDLVLQELALPPGSEILVSALTIRDMCRIIEHHRLVAVPIDLDQETLAIDIGELERIIGPRTKAILVAHLFGSRMPLAPVIDVARRHGLLVIEDCAQTYDGSSYHGDTESDISMFSFGPIKTFTALGGALLRFKDRTLLKKVRERQARYPRQQRRAFARRVVLFAALKLLAHRLPLLLFVSICQLRGRNHDQILSQAVRGFAGSDLIARLRRQPSSPLLRLLDRRLRMANPAQIAWRSALARRIITATPTVNRPGAHAALHAHWVLPVQSHNPDGLVRLLWVQGFDATRHASSLIVVPPPVTHMTDAPVRMIRMMENLLYLPIYPTMTEQEITRLSRIVADFEPRTSQQPDDYVDTAVV
jgi:dTDP-4-amino-4,6-dideoxygalactose transaminase